MGKINIYYEIVHLHVGYMQTEYNRDDHVWNDYGNAVGREKMKGINWK